jgi:hypothetical protein
MKNDCCESFAMSAQEQCEAKKGVAPMTVPPFESRELDALLLRALRVANAK